MWTVLFGDEEDDTCTPPRDAVKTHMTSLSPQDATPAVTPSPLDQMPPLTPSPCPSLARDRHVIVTSEDTQSSEKIEDSAMTMLLKRMNNLMVKVGQHEFEKKTLVDQMEKERKVLIVQIQDLGQQVEDLKDQNVQLQYQIEYTSEPMLMERVQDITDMRDALAVVKKQLEAELQEKEKELKSALETNKKLSELQEKYETQIDDLTAACEAAKQETAEAVRLASDAASAKYEEQLKHKEVALQTVTEMKETLEASVTEKEQALDVAKAATVEMQKNLEEVRTRSEVDVKALKQLHQKLEEVACEHEQKLQQLQDEHHQKVAALAKHAQEQKAFAASKAQELEDYKHDCAELWKINEDMKQQIALMSVESTIKQTELRENALSGQTVLQSKVAELENQLKELQERLNQKNQEIVELQTEGESRVIAESEGEALEEEDEKFVVVESDGSVIGVLTEQVATAQRELTEAMELNLHLNNRNAWLEEQYQMLSSVQSEGDDDQEDTALSTPSLEERIAALGRELQDAERAANEKAEHVSNLEQNYSALSTEFDRLLSAHNTLVEVKQADDDALNDLRQELESLRTLKASVFDKDQALLTKEQELILLRTSNSALVTEAERLGDAASQLQQTRDELIQTQNSLAGAEATKLDLERELVELRNISAATSKSNEHVAVIQNELTQVRSERDSLVAELTRSQAFIHELQQRVHELKDLVNNHINEKKSLEQQVENLQEMTRENMEGSYELQANLESTMEELENSKSQLRAEQEKCERLQHEVEAAKQSSVSRDELDRAKSEITSMEQQIRQFRGLEQSLTQQLQDVVRSKDEIAAELQTVCSKRAAADEEQKKLKTLYEQATAQLASVQSSASELQHSYDDLSDSLEKARAQATQAEQQLNTIRAEHGDAQRQVESLTKKNLLLVSEVQSMRDEADNKQQVAHGQLEQLKAVHADVQRQLEDATRALQGKDAEVVAATQRSQSEVARLQDLVNRYKADKQVVEERLAQLNADCERLRQAYDEAKTIVGRSRHDLEQMHAQLSTTQQEKKSLEAEVGQLRGLNDEKVHLLHEVDELKRANQKLEETNCKLEGLLQNSKAYCKELSRDSEDKVSRAQEFTRHVEQEARDEIDRIVHENTLLRDELEQLAQARLEETNAHDVLRVKLAELQAENNVLSARAHRLTQQLSQYTDLPEDDELAAAGQGQTPDLWELLSSGMEQLKADLELASKYAVSIDASSVDGGIGDESFTNAN
ncbi:unnamed protein product [Peronospora farinosa]|uniref:Uncharacterized protein n=1 Tax=Peronospora farinosa TaxID=134698 RepID=A0AAV0SZZ2_9STRA|nr:unnamed protein product [Peronospora farinosa]CAI5711780.1 unnamed protein product [Peronospora farinosa]